VIQPSDELEPPRLADESRWYTEHTALVVDTLKWALLGSAARLCDGAATRVFLGALDVSSRLVARAYPGRLAAWTALPWPYPRASGSSAPSALSPAATAPKPSSRRCTKGPARWTGRSRP
jgi:hypothetical protein